MKTMKASRSHAGLAFLLLFVLLAAGIVTTGYVYYREAYAPMREQFWQVVIMASALLLGAGSCVVLIWRQQRGRSYREFAEMDNSARRMATVVRDSNDAITIQDFAGRITAWNHGAELMYGYSEAEALAMNIVRSERCPTE
jgi:PAS domain-containing protein